jgi:hypothetical protein
MLLLITDRQNIRPLSPLGISPSILPYTTLYVILSTMYKYITGFYLNQTASGSVRNFESSVPFANGIILRLALFSLYMFGLNFFSYFPLSGSATDELRY